MSLSPPINGILRRLVQDNLLSLEQAQQAIQDANKIKMPIHQYLKEKNIVEPRVLMNANAHEFGMPFVDLIHFDPKYCSIKILTEELVLKHKVVPLQKRSNRLFVAISDPTNTKAIDEIRFQTNCLVEVVLAEQDAIQQLIDRLLSIGDDLSIPTGEDLNLEAEGDDDDDDENNEGVASLEGSTDDTPVVKFVNRLLIDSIKKGASDIHFEPYEDEYRVRFRMDGMLRTIAKAPQKLHSRIAARIKVMSAMDISEKRLPQDGRIKLLISKNKQMDFRVNTCPTLFGEKIVMRMLDGGAAKLGIDKLGYEPEQKELYLKALANPYGMILVTGPTGSGKTVSLYTGLNILNTEERNISTAEDPVEIRVPGINQVQMNPKKGMNFSTALRAFLRQDPDVIMVGEIRDLETAEIAVKAAQTGHLVLSTLHTNDAPQTISRLMNMGIAPYNITSSVTLIIAQRLGRRLCNNCKKPVDIPYNVLKQAGFTDEDLKNPMTCYEAVGCEQCNEGYKGRVGIYQVMPMLEDIQRIILDGGNAMQIAEVSRAAGVKDLRDSALKKVREGLISLAEADRVTKS